MINRFEGIILRGPTDPLDEILDDIFFEFACLVSPQPPTRLRGLRGRVQEGVDHYEALVGNRVRVVEQRKRYEVENTSIEALGDKLIL